MLYQYFSMKANILKKKVILSGKNYSSIVFCQEGILIKAIVKYVVSLSAISFCFVGQRTAPNVHIFNKNFASQKIRAGLVRNKLVYVPYFCFLSPGSFSPSTHCLPDSPGEELRIIKASERPALTGCCVELISSTGMGIWSQKREGIEISITSIKEIPESQSISANP